MFHVVELFAIRRKLNLNVARVWLSNLHDSFTVHLSGIYNLFCVLLFHELIAIAIQNLLIIRLVLGHFALVAEFPIIFLLVYVVVFGLPVVDREGAQTMNSLPLADKLRVHVLNVLVFVRKNMTLLSIIDLVKEQAIIRLNNLV